MVSVALVKGPREPETVYKAIKLAGGLGEAAKNFDKALIKVKDTKQTITERLSEVNVKAFIAEMKKNKGEK